jgi:hypothetical protein
MIQVLMSPGKHLVHSSSGTRAMNPKKLTDCQGSQTGMLVLTGEGKNQGTQAIESLPATVVLDIWLRA